VACYKRDFNKMRISKKFLALGFLLSFQAFKGAGQKKNRYEENSEDCKLCSRRISANHHCFYVNLLPYEPPLQDIPCCTLYILAVQ
jgi:hypothetical protein